MICTTCSKGKHAYPVSWMKYDDIGTRIDRRARIRRSGYTESFIGAFSIRRLYPLYHNIVTFGWVNLGSIK